MRYKDLPKVPFVYQPAKGLPGLMAIPVSELIDNSEAVVKWQKNDGDNTLGIDYPLNSASVVFDVGGYLGDWSARIIKRYDPFVFIFEPVKSFYEALVERFSENSKVRIFNFGLSSESGFSLIGKNKDGSSLYRDSITKEIVELRNIETFVWESGVSAIDLISLNCEGEEYLLLLKMLDSGIIRSFHNIQVQFHIDHPNAARLRDEIRWWLENTHDEVYNYPFVWESWKIRK